MEKEKNVICYDDQCQFCINQIDTIKSMDTNKEFEYVPRSAPDLTQRFPALQDMNFEEGMRMISSDNKVYVGADAIHQIAEKLPATGFIAWLYNVPGIKQICRMAYAWVAANRHKLAGSCKTNTCAPKSMTKH